MDQLTRDWTDDELVNEIRRRERRAGTGGQRRAGAPPAGRARDLASIPTGELVRAAKGLRAGLAMSERTSPILSVLRLALGERFARAEGLAQDTIRLAHFVRESNGGGGGIRTPVRKCIPAGIYDAYPPLLSRARREEAAKPPDTSPEKSRY